MKKFTFIALIIIVSVSNSFSQNKNFIDQPFLETKAKVDTLVTPDRIYLNIIITEKDTKGKTSVEELESKMESRLKSLGIDTKKNLTLNDLASNFKKYFLKSQDVLKMKSYTLMVTDAIIAGKVVIALEKMDISNVSINRTEYSKIENLRLELKSKAVLKAKKQAEYLCKPLNQQVGNAIFIADTYASHNFRNMSSSIQIRGAASLEQTKFKPADIQFDKIKVEAEVNVKFVLGGKKI